MRGIRPCSTGRCRHARHPADAVRGVRGFYLRSGSPSTFSPARMLAGLHQLGLDHDDDDPARSGSSLPIYLKALGETLSIALLGTTLAALFALSGQPAGARNVVPSIIFRFPVRRFLDSIRGVDTLIWALVWINVVGLGPFAGVLAIAVSDFGAFGQAVLRGRRRCGPASRSKASAPPAATRCTKSASAFCRRCCP